MSDPAETLFGQSIPGNSSNETETATASTATTRLTTTQLAQRVNGLSTLLSGNIKKESKFVKNGLKINHQLS